MSIFDNGISMLETPFTASVEDLYQAFKERLIAELLVDHPDLRSYGLLTEAVTHGQLTPRAMKRQE